MCHVQQLVCDWLQIQFGRLLQKSQTVKVQFKSNYYELNRNTYTDTCTQNKNVVYASCTFD